MLWAAMPGKAFVKLFSRSGGIFSAARRAGDAFPLRAPLISGQDRHDERLIGTTRCSTAPPFWDVERFSLDPPKERREAKGGAAAERELAPSASIGSAVMG